MKQNFFWKNFVKKNFSRFSTPRKSLRSFSFGSLHTAAERGFFYSSFLSIQYIKTIPPFRMRACPHGISFRREHAKKSSDCSNWVNRTAFSIGCTRYARIRKRNTPRGLSGGVARQRDFPPTRLASLSPCGAEPCPSPMPHRSQSRTGTIQSPFWKTERHGLTNFSALPCPGPYRSFQGAKRPVDGKHRQRAAEFDEETVNP